MADQPWHELPPEVVEVLRPALDDVAHEMMEAVATIPAYARPLEGPFGDGLRIGVQEALKHLLAEIEAGGHVERLDVYRSLGQGEMRAGRSLESLLSAYRIGARVAWRRFAALGVDAGLAPDTLYLLAESIFAYIDVLSAESAEGYALEQSAAAGEAQLRRRRLVRMLVRETPAEPDAVERAAADAGWALPRSLAVVAISGPRREAAASHLPAGTIREAIGELMCAVVSDPDGPGQRGGHRAGDRGRRGSGGARLDGRLVPGAGELRARPGRAGAGGARRHPDRGPRVRRRAAAALRPRAGRRARRRPAGAASRPVAGIAHAVCGRPWRCGWPSRGGSVASPSDSASTRRRRATGSAGCATCSATRWTIPRRGSGWRWRCGWAAARSAQT